MSQDADDRRQYSRIPFEAAVTIMQGDSSLSAQLVDISINGVLIETPESYHFRTDTPCRIHIELCNDIVITMQVALVHSSSSMLGFHCTSIDMESMAHLRKIIESNLGDPLAPGRVLDELVKRQEELSRLNKA